MKQKKTVKKKEKVIVTKRSLRKKTHNYNYLKIQKKVKFEKLDIKNKTSIHKIINKYKTKQRNYQRFTDRKTNITPSKRKKCLEKKTKFLKIYMASKTGH